VFFVSREISLGPSPLPVNRRAFQMCFPGPFCIMQARFQIFFAAASISPGSGRWLEVFVKPFEFLLPSEGNCIEMLQIALKL
jgi:hypothetical protein